MKITWKPKINRYTDSSTQVHQTGPPREELTEPHRSKLALGDASLIQWAQHQFAPLGTKPGAVEHAKCLKSTEGGSKEGRMEDEKQPQHTSTYINYSPSCTLHIYTCYIFVSYFREWNHAVEIWLHSSSPMESGVHELTVPCHILLSTCAVPMAKPCNCLDSCANTTVLMSSQHNNCQTIILYILVQTSCALTCPKPLNPKSPKIQHEKIQKYLHILLPWQTGGLLGPPRFAKTGHEVSLPTSLYHLSLCHLPRCQHQHGILQVGICGNSHSDASCESTESVNTMIHLHRQPLLMSRSWAAHERNQTGYGWLHWIECKHCLIFSTYEGLCENGGEDKLQSPVSAIETSQNIRCVYILSVTWWLPSIYSRPALWSWSTVDFGSIYIYISYKLSKSRI